MLHLTLTLKIILQLLLLYSIFYLAGKLGFAKFCKSVGLMLILIQEKMPLVHSTINAGLMTPIKQLTKDNETSAKKKKEIIIFDTLIEK